MTVTEQVQVHEDGTITPYPPEDPMAITYDLAPGATAANLNQLIQERSYRFSPPILLMPGEFEFGSQIIMRPYAQVVGAGRNRTLVKATFAPSSALADDPTNSFFTSYSPVGAVATTLATKAYRGSYKITPTSTAGITAGMYLRIKGNNTLGDEYLTSDEANSINCEIVLVDEVSGPDLILAGRLRTHLSAGLPVVSITPLIGAAIADLTMESATATIATGLELRHQIDFTVDDVAFSGFCRSDIGVFHGGHNTRLATWRNGGSNAHVMAEATHALTISGMRCDPNGDRFHPTLGKRRHLITTWGDCDGMVLEDVKCEHAGGAVLIQAGHATRVSGLLARDMLIDHVHDALASTGEGAGTQRSTGVVQFGNAGGIGWPANMIAGRFDDITVEECFSEYAVVPGKAACYAMVFHDGIHCFGDRWTISYTGSKVSQSENPLDGGGTNFLRGVLFQDVTGRVRDLHVRGLAVAIDWGGNYNPDIIGHTAVGTNGAGGAEGNGAYWSGVDMADPSASSGPLLRDVTVDYQEGGYYGIINGFRPPASMRFENFFFLFRCSKASWRINKTGGDVEAGQAVALDETAGEVLAGYPQTKVATGAAGETPVVAVFGERSNQNSDGQAMIFADILGDIGVKVKAADVVRPGDKLVVDNTVVGGLTGKDWKKDNAATAGYVVAVASKAGGSRAIVQAVKP